MQRNDNQGKGNGRPPPKNLPVKATDRAALGKKGELIAATWLEKQGYIILARNWRSGHLELDLVARQKSVMVIVEVKTRQEFGRDPPGRPEEAVQYLKQQRMARAALAFLDAQNGHWELRFDIIAIRVRGDRCRLYHQQDAFFPGF